MAVPVLERMGLFVFPWGKPPPTPRQLVDWSVEAEEYGFDSVQMPWHYTLPNIRSFLTFENRACLDPLPLLAAIGQATERIRVGINAVVMPVMNPFAWAQYFSTMSHLTEGRVIAGVAGGWWKEDFQATGAAMPGRTARMEEGLALLRDLFEGNEIAAAGAHYDLTGMKLDPLPHEGGIDLWLGGGIKAVDRAARWTDAICPVSPTIAGLQDFEQALDQAQDEVGNRPKLASITYVMIEDDPAVRESYRAKMVARVNGTTLEEAAANGGDDRYTNPDDCVVWGTPAECAQRLTELAAAGVDYFVLDFNFHGIESVDFGRAQTKRFIEEVVPLLDATSAHTAGV